MTAFAPDYRPAEVVASPNHGERRDGQRPDMIILHYTGMPTAQGALDWLISPESEVSSHYMVFEDGRVVQIRERRAARSWRPGRAQKGARC